MRTIFSILLAALGALFSTAVASAQDLPITVSNDSWTARWISHPEAGAQEAGVFHFRRDFELAELPESLLVRVSADNRYRLFVNGQSVSVGPARSDVMHWRYQAVDLAPFLRAGTNVLAATVWNWGEQAPVAQMSHRTGFLLQGEGEAAELVDSGTDWQVLRDPAYSFQPVDGQALGGYYAAAPEEVFDGNAHPWGWMDDEASQLDWQQARASFFPAESRGANMFGAVGQWQLVPSPLPEMEEGLIRFAAIRRHEGAEPPEGLLTGEADFTVPANSRASFLLDQRQLTNAYPVLRGSGGAGASVSLTYAESLFDADGNKGDRNAIEGKTIRGLSDRFTFDGGEDRRFQSLWWRTWRYVQVDIETADEPLVLHDLHGIFTAYPFELNASFGSDAEWIAPIWEIDWRILRLSAFDTFMDTPYYEQLQYVGDTRMESLISLYNSGDDRLMRNAIELYDQSRTPDGITASRYPSSMRQNIPPFSLWWVSMVHDYWMLRDDPEFVAGFLPGIRGVLSWYERHVDETGMLGPMPWWNFLDWSPEFTRGMAPGSQDSHSAALTLQYAYALRRAAELEERFGQAALAGHYLQAADALGAAVRENAWDEERGLFADTPEMTSYSQHTNVLAVLSDTVPEADKRAFMTHVLADEDLLQATYYFRFYVDEALVEAGLADLYIDRLGPWQEMIRMGLTTTPEQPDPTRSDSHAWSAHPNYHLLASVLGIRPASEGFGSLRIAPALGPLRVASGTMPHPAGPIRVSFRRQGENGLAGEVELPEGLSGTLVWQDQEIALEPGWQAIALAGN